MRATVGGGVRADPEGVHGKHEVLDERLVVLVWEGVCKGARAPEGARVNAGQRGRVSQTQAVREVRPGDRRSGAW